MDGRKRWWFPQDAWTPHDTVYAAVMAAFGWEGVGVLTAVEAAAKRSPIEGTFMYASEAEAWVMLGGPTPDGWSLDALWTVTGRMKYTRRTRHGHRTHVTFTRWERPRKTWSGGGNTDAVSRLTETETETTTDVVSSSFEEFHRQRVATMIRKQIDNGYEADSESAVIAKAVVDPDHVAESKRIWSHRDCEKCEGSGSTRLYSAGSGGLSVPCDGPR